jgi:hypothetical protein
MIRDDAGLRARDSRTWLTGGLTRELTVGLTRGLTVRLTRGLTRGLTGGRGARKPA